MPDRYRSDEPSSGIARDFWRDANNRLVDHFEAVQRLSFRLDAKAGYLASPALSEPDEISPEAADSDTVISFDGHSATLREWCDQFETPIELA
jgi:hypothetical protein